MIRWGILRATQTVLVVCVLALFAGALLGQPILLSFVETGSMEPTIDTGDGFIAIPSALTGEPEVGDVVVFEAEEIEGGGLTTHRIVGAEERGYITQGDANLGTDQEAGEPVVQDAQIVATAVSVGGTTVTIPHLGTAVMALGDGLDSLQHWLALTLGLDVFLGAGGLAALVLVLSVVLYAIETVRERRQRSYESRVGRDEDFPIDAHHLCIALALLVAISAGAAMVVPGGAHSYDVVSAEFDSDRPLVIEQGTTETVSYDVINGGLVPIVSYLEPGSEGVGVDAERFEVGPRDDVATTVSLTAPDDTGYYPMYVTEHRYLHVLPGSVIDTLHDVHPWVPILTIVSLAGSLTYLLGRLAMRGGDVRTVRREKRTARATRFTRRYDDTND